MKNKLFQMIGEKYENYETLDRLMEGEERENLRDEIRKYAAKTAKDLGIDGTICVSLPCLTCDDQSVEFDVFVVSFNNGVASVDVHHYETEF